MAAKKKRAKKRGVGRPRIVLAAEALALAKTLAQIRCTTAEIGSALRSAGHDVSDRTLERNFGGQLKEWREAGKSSLRRAQWATALKGNATMQIWLGKQELGQKDREREKYRPDAPQQTEERVRQYTMLFGQRVEF